MRGIYDGTLPRFLKHAVVGQTAITLLAIWGFAGWHVFADREATLESGRQQLRTVSAGVHAAVEVTLNDAIGSALAATREIEQLGDLGTLPVDAVRQALARNLATSEYVKALFVATSERYIKASREPGVQHEDTLVPDWLRNGLHDRIGNIFVGLPIDSPDGGGSFIPIAELLSEPDQPPRWAGALIGIDALNRLYRRMRFDAGVLGIYVSTGDVLVRVPAPTGTYLTPAARQGRAELLTQQTGAEEDLMERPGPVTGLPTLFYMRRINGYPVIVAAIRTRPSILQPWRDRTIALGATLSVISALAIALTLLLRRFATKLERRESHYRTLFNNTTVAVLLMLNERFVEANTTTYRMFEIPDGVHLEGLGAADISPERQPDGRLSVDASHLLIEQAQRLGQLRFRWMCKRLQSQQEFPVEVSLSSIQSEDETLILAIVSDLSELEAARMELQTLNSKLEQRVLERTAALQEANARLALTNKELEAFSASASHDLRSPLGSIAGQAGLLREELQSSMSDSVRYRLNRIAISVQRCADIIDGLLSLAKLSRQELVSERVDVSSLAATIVDELRSQYAHQVQCSIDPGIVLYADPRLLKSLFNNLLDNAFKYTSKSPDPRMDLRFEMRDDTPHFTIIDNGVGFEMAHAERLFEPFQRMHGMDEFPGTGIGLAIVERIVRRYGGSVRVDSAPDQGTAVHFSMPLATARHREVITGQTVAHH